LIEVLKDQFSKPFKLKQQRNKEITRISRKGRVNQIGPTIQDPRLITKLSLLKEEV